MFLRHGAMQPLLHKVRLKVSRRKQSPKKRSPKMLSILKLGAQLVVYVWLYNQLCIIMRMTYSDERPSNSNTKAFAVKYDPKGFVATSKTVIFGMVKSKLKLTYYINRWFVLTLLQALKLWLPSEHIIWATHGSLQASKSPRTGQKIRTWRYVDIYIL